MSGLEVLFAALGLLSAGGGLAAVTARPVVHAGLWLVVSLAGLAGCILVLGAELVALVHLIVYVGGVVVVVLFALMLTRAPLALSGRARPAQTRHDPPDPPDPIDHPLPHRIGAAVVAAATTVLLAVVLITTLDGGRGRPLGPDSAEIGEQIFGTWVWPFELLSVLLLVALVAGVAVARIGVAPGREGADAVDAADGAVERAEGES